MSIKHKNLFCLIIYNLLIIFFSMFQVCSRTINVKNRIWGRPWALSFSWFTQKQGSFFCDAISSFLDMFHVTDSLNRAREMNNHYSVLDLDTFNRNITDFWYIFDGWQGFFPLPFCRALSKKSIPMESVGAPAFLSMENPLLHSNTETILSRSEVFCRYYS